MQKKANRGIFSNKKGALTYKKSFYKQKEKVTNALKSIKKTKEKLVRKYNSVKKEKINLEKRKKLTKQDKKKFSIEIKKAKKEIQKVEKDLFKLKKQFDALVRISAIAKKIKNLKDFAISQEKQIKSKVKEVEDFKKDLDNTFKDFEKNEKDINKGGERKKTKSPSGGSKRSKFEEGTNLKDLPKFKGKKPVDESKKKGRRIPRLSFDSKQLDNKILTFEGTFRERKFPNKGASKSNPIVTKKIILRDTKNRALKRVADRVDKSLAASLTLKVVGVGKAKKDISEPSNLRKFNTKKSVGTPVLRLVEKASARFDTRGETREAKKLKKASPKKKVVTKKKKR